ncbi:MAG: Cytochrome c oxidase subunit 3 [Anaerolineales bacterium]|nr:Cytochrome c oxidase subunit 3 [Anaerolineales bacterium]
MDTISVIGERENRQMSTGRSNNWWALVLVILVETMFFGSLISAYLFLRFEGVNWLPAGDINLSPLLAGVNTLVLLVSSLAVHQASSAVQAGDSDKFRTWLPVAVLLGGGFLALQGYIFAHAGFTPFDRAFGGMFFALTGFHALRIVIGIGLMLYAFARSLRGELTPTNHFAVTVATAYWHFLDGVWVVLFVFLYLL